MELASLHELYVEGLRDLYSAEHQILKALPKLHKGATSPTVKDAFTAHLAETEEHVVRLEEIFADLLEEDANPDVLDAGLISSAQHVEHYEMATSTDE